MNPHSHSTRPATTADLPRLLDLLAQLNPKGIPLPAGVAEATWAQMAATPGLTVFVAQQDGELAATCTLIVTPHLLHHARPFGLIENVVTSAAHRRQGHGNAVLQAAFEAAWVEGCYKVMLMTGRKDPAVHDFYRRAGFEQTKTGYQIRRD
jgi:GNAT superfamily N-acetyltransferase